MKSRILAAVAAATLVLGAAGLSQAQVYYGQSHNYPSYGYGGGHYHYYPSSNHYGHYNSYQGNYGNYGNYGNSYYNRGYNRGWGGYGYGGGSGLYINTPRFGFGLRY